MVVVVVWTAHTFDTGLLNQGWNGRRTYASRMGNRTKCKDNTKCPLATRLRSYTRACGRSGAGRAVGRRGNAVRVVEGRGSCRWP